MLRGAKFKKLDWERQIRRKNERKKFVMINLETKIKCTKIKGYAKEPAMIEISTYKCMFGNMESGAKSL